MAKPKRATLLFYYDSTMANPNGDPTTNQPRMIGDTNIVTDNRLKRTIRDQLTNMEEPIFFVPQYKPRTGEQKTIEELGAQWLSDVAGGMKRVNKKKFLDNFIDLRLFGLMYVVKKLVNPFKFTGPVQFTIGQSLNKVEEELIEITRVVTSSEEKRGGAMGHHSILRYSFLEFLGTINPAAILEENNLTEEDVKKMLKALWNGTNELRTTSKNQSSRLLLKINVKDDVLLTDLSRVNTLENDENLNTISDVILNVTNSFRQLEAFASSIESVEYKANPLLVCQHENDTGSFDELIESWATNTNITVRQLTL